MPRKREESLLVDWNMKAVKRRRKEMEKHENG